MVRWLDGPFRKQINFSYVSNIVIENILQKKKKRPVHYWGRRYKISMNTLSKHYVGSM